MKELIAYFSRNGENYLGGMLKYIEVGNTEQVAHVLQEESGAALFKIEQRKPYSADYNESTEEAKADKSSNARPELIAFPESIDEYSVIYLGYPNYWNTMPMAVFTFLEHFDFSGKTIRPFCTHEGSGLGSSIEDIKRCCPGANVEQGLAIFGSQVAYSKDKVLNWYENQ